MGLHFPEVTHCSTVLQSLYVTHRVVDPVKTWFLRLDKWCERTHGERDWKMDSRVDGPLADAVASDSATSPASFHRPPRGSGVIAGRRKW